MGDVELLEELRRAETFILPVEKLKPNSWNPNEMEETAWQALGQSIVKYGIHLQPLVVRPMGDRYQIIDGEHRYKWAYEMGIKDIPAVIIDVDDFNAKKLTQILNRTRGEDNPVALKELLDSLLVDHSPEEVIEGMAIADSQELDRLLADLEKQISNDFGLNENSVTEGLTDDDEIPEDTETRVKSGDIWQLGNHRAMCGDSTDARNVEALINGNSVTLVHADPPYGMGKEKDGVANDNLYREKLDGFQMQWIKTCRKHVKDNGSFYIWGNAEDLWRLWYNGGLKDGERMTFRNQIVWDKSHGQGMQSADFRMYPTATEHCLFFMLGEQGFNNEYDNFFDGFEPIRAYLYDQRKLMKWDGRKIKEVAGHNPSGHGDHWTGKSQWSMPTEDAYKAWQKEANGQAFKREYEDIKREYEDIKREFYATRAYFDNTHDNMTDVWGFPRVTGEDRHGHATPKPVAMIERIIKSSCPEEELCYEPFLGSGTTLIACEKTNRTCYGMELSEKYCDVILQRWENFTGQTAKFIKNVAN